MDGLDILILVHGAQHRLIISGFRPKNTSDQSHIGEKHGSAGVYRSVVGKNAPCRRTAVDGRAARRRTVVRHYAIQKPEVSVSVGYHRTASAPRYGTRVFRRISMSVRNGKPLDASCRSAVGTYASYCIRSVAERIHKTGIAGRIGLAGDYRIFRRTGGYDPYPCICRSQGYAATGKHPLGVFRRTFIVYARCHIDNPVIRPDFIYGLLDRFERT